MITNTIKFIGSRTAPNPIEIDYWIDTKTDPYGTAIKYHNGIDWVNLFKHDNIDIDLANYYTKKQVDSKLSIKADINTVNNMFSTLNDTKADKTSTYTKSEINTLFLNFDPFDETKYYTKVEIDTKGYLTEVPAQYITEDELSSYTYDKDNIDSIFATKTYVVDEIAKAVLDGEIDLTGYATEKWVEEKGYLTEHLTIDHLASKDYVDTSIADLIDDAPETLNTLREISEAIKENEDIVSTLNDAIGSKADKSSIENLVTKEDAQSTYQPKGDYALKSELPSIEGLATEKYVDEKFDDIQYPDIDLTGYVTEEWINDKGFVTDQSLSNYVTTSNLTSELNKKQDTITDIADIRSDAKKGATAVQSSDLAKVATSGLYDDLSDTPTIPTSETITEWGFTKNTGTYSKPDQGIPASDLSEDVQNLLEKANNSIQDVPMASSEKYGGVIASEKTIDYVTEVKIDSSTGILYVPKTNQILPDEEDVTINTIDGKEIIRFKNKSYESASYNGLGRVYLRKNMINGVNVLTQAMFVNEGGSACTNTRYIILYDYDLQGDEIIVPAGCVLVFQGGSVSNGTINGNDFSVMADYETQIFYNTNLGGCSKVYAAWFGVSPNNEDNSLYIAQALKNPSLTYPGNRTVVFGDGVFKIKQSVEISSANIVGSAPVNKLNGNKDIEYKTIFQLEGNCPLFTVHNTNDMLYSIATTYMENCMMRCMSKIEYPNSIGIDTNTATLKIRNCEIYGFVKGLNAYALISSEFDKVDFAYNTTAVYFASKGANISTSTWFRRCYIYESGVHFKNEANSVLDCHFNACIFESAKTKSMEINPYGFVVLHLTDCYSENNRTEDYETSKYDVEILPVTLTDVIYFKLLSVGNIWAGQNFGADKWGTFIKVNAGTFYSYGDTYTRYNYAMEIDDTTAVRINVDFNSHIFSGSIAALDEEQSKISIARTNLYIHTVAGDGREVQTSVPQVNLQLRDGAYPKIGISAERDISLQRKALCMKSENNGVVRVYDNNLLSIGPKVRVGNASNGISLPLNDSVNVLSASPKQAFLSVGKSETGTIVPILSYSTDKDAEFTNEWSNKIIPLFDQANGAPSASTNLPEALLRFDRKNGGLYAYSHYWGRNVNVMDGYPPVLRKGTFAEKPTASTLLDGMDYYCTDLKKKILCNGTEWVNMDGSKIT